MNPPRLPTELMNPTLTAAADSPRKMVGSAQKDGPHAHSMRPVSDSQIIVSQNGCAVNAVNAKKMLPNRRGTAVCNFRSPRRSDDLPMNQTPGIAARNGRAESSVALRTLYPDAR